MSKATYAKLAHNFDQLLRSAYDGQQLLLAGGFEPIEGAEAVLAMEKFSDEAYGNGSRILRALRIAAIVEEIAKPDNGTMEGLFARGVMLRATDETHGVSGSDATE